MKSLQNTPYDKLDFQIFLLFSAQARGRGSRGAEKGGTIFIEDPKRGGGALYMREIGTMWQIGVLTGKPCTFLVQNWSFSAFWHYKNKEKLSRGLDVKWHIPSTCLDASRKWVFYWALQHKQGFRVAMAGNTMNPLKWPKCAPFPG